MYEPVELQDEYGISMGESEKLTGELVKSTSEPRESKIKRRIR